MNNPTPGNTYHNFLHSRRHSHTPPAIDVHSDDLSEHLFGFQKEIVAWALRRGRAAIFADCGLGKTPMQLEWATKTYEATGKPVLILTPLAVTFQTLQEAQKFGVDAALTKTGEVDAPVVIANYERLHYYNPNQFAAVVCDESSAIKAFDGHRRAEVTAFIRKTPYRLLCTATAAPNDYIELGTASEALGELGYMDMLNRFFVNDNRTSAQRGWGKQSQWRFKGHAQDPFWKWVTQWARALRKPSDMGYDDDGFILPPLHENTHVVASRDPQPDRLFDLPALGMAEERAETRRTLDERTEHAAQLVEHDRHAITWCTLNDESKRLTELIDGAHEVKGSDPTDKKEETLAAFSNGEIRVLVTKPSIGAWGLNWQHCDHLTYFPSHSYEQYYQAVRRCWRFGQTNPVTVDIITTEGGKNALTNLQRKSDQANNMFTRLVDHMNDAQTSEPETPQHPQETPEWL
jgi:hypothetical protein